jgi:hypothetical protein
MNFVKASVAGAVIALLASASQALASPSCPASPACVANGQTFTQTGGTSGNGLTFLAFFTTSGQSNSGIAADVLAFLGAEGITGVDYLGRQDGSGLVGGDHISVTNDGGLSGTWTFSPGTTNDIGTYVAIHAGEGQNDTLFAINTPGLTGTWSTFNGHGLSNFDLFGIDPPPPSRVPEPLTLSLFGAGLAGAAVLRRRKKNAA